MALPDKIDTGATKPTYIDAQAVQFKTTDGKNHRAGQYTAYLRESKTTAEYDNIEGIIIAKGAYLQKQVGRPSSTKSVEHKSQEFSMKYGRGDGEIRIRELRRENGEFTTSQIDKGIWSDFVGEEGKGYRVITCLYVYHPETDDLYRVEFSPVCSMETRTWELMPKKYAKLSKSKEVVSNDYGDFAMPQLEYTGDVDEELHDAIERKYNEVNAILDHVDYAPTPTATVDDVADDLPF